jgi:hypothetical protein
MSNITPEQLAFIYLHEYAVNIDSPQLIEFKLNFLDEYYNLPKSKESILALMNIISWSEPSKRAMYCRYILKNAPCVEFFTVQHDSDKSFSFGAKLNGEVIVQPTDSESLDMAIAERFKTTPIRFENAKDTSGYLAQNIIESTKLIA